ncbi:hypothetical protein KPH14_005975 [Odynerus spinipes]|uniref:Ribosomal protein S30 n=1 Tax=Odynerus spinipes TaxID=1348599 RepID=A0AAD9VN51_9HYME|nr:hypothetical protein KPH14_005975 [Odynerus spinipes]
MKLQPPQFIHLYWTCPLKLRQEEKGKRERGLPAFYSNVITTEELESIVNDIKGLIEDTIAFEYSSRKRKHELNEEQLESKHVMENIIANSVIQQINRTLQTNLATSRPHLLEAQTDFEPRVEAFWFAGGINPTEAIQKLRKNMPYLKLFEGDPINVRVQYLGKSVLHLRHDYPLKEIMSLSESENPSLEVPQFKFDPRVLGYTFKRRHGTNIPGFWPGDPCEFGLLSYHNRGHMHTRPETFDDESDALITQAIFASYSWLLSQACYQGFSTFQDITYPLVNQAVITNGQDWSFYVYQLNTTLLYAEHADENPRRNICWVTEPTKLFEKVEGEKVYGLNTDVLKSLIQFYVNAPAKRSEIDMKPYLGKSVQVIADITHTERREWLERRYKHLVTNRPRHRRMPEIYHWQKIYVLDNKTRPLDKKRHPFEFGINVLNRRLDDHTPRYIPRCLRANPKKRSVGRWEKTYYP